LNIFEENYNFLYKNRKSIFLFIKSFFKSLHDIIIKRKLTFYNPIIKIENLENYLIKINKEKNEAKDYYLKKLSKLYNKIHKEIQ